MTPFITIAGGITGISSKAGQVLQRMDILIEKVEKIEIIIHDHERRLTVIEVAKG